MQHKFLLRFIKEELARNQIVFKNNEAFFRFFLPDASWDSYRSNMSNWLSVSEEDGSIRKTVFIHAINEKLGLQPDVWKASDYYQKERVKNAIEAYTRNALDDKMFTWLEDEAVSEEQEAFLEFAFKASLMELKETMPRYNALFEKSSKNQMFLIDLFNHMYERGEYQFVYEYIFPSLLDSYDNKIKSRKADIYASLPQPMYKEAFEILNSIKGESDDETIDLRTAAISNIKREKFSSKTLSYEELKTLLHRLIKCYNKMYTPKKSYSYYPGINLAYMVTMIEYLFPNEVEKLTEGYTLRQIYNDVKSSLEKGIASKEKEERYYAGMSKIEFQLLLGQQSSFHDLELFLEELEPSIYQVKQTQRQMGLFFVDMIETYSDEAAQKLYHFKKALTLLDTYIELF